MTHAGRVLLLATVLGLFGAGIVGAIFSERRVSTAIPGRAPIHSLAVIDDGFLVGTGEGVFASSDGERWGRQRSLPQDPAQVATVGEVAYAAIQKRVFRLDRIRESLAVASLDKPATAVGGSATEAFVAIEGPTIVSVHSGGMTKAQTMRPGEIVSLTASGSDPAVILIGSPSGVWESPDEGATWINILGTPTTAILADAAEERRIFIGTPGGLLVSRDRGRSWQFTEMRGGISGLSFFRNTYYVVSGRVVWSSEDGDSGWRPLS